jgi:uncharacterized membrane protein
MIYAAFKTIHILSIVVWVGGMVFAHFFLRPAVAALEPPQRLRLMDEVLRRFFAVVSGVALLTFFTGVAMIGRVAKETVQAGGSFAMPLDWTVMSVLGTLMVLIYGHIRMVLYRRLRRTVQAEDWTAAAAHLGQLRQWVAVNLAIGLFLIAFTLLA